MHQYIPVFILQHDIYTSHGMVHIQPVIGFTQPPATDLFYNDTMATNIHASVYSLYYPKLTSLICPVHITYSICGSPG